MKILFFLFIAYNLFACGCVDLGTAGMLNSASQSNYLNNDANILSKLQMIGTALKNMYQNQENNSARNIEYSIRLKNEILMKEKQVLFNSKAINALEDHKSDALMIGAEMKALTTELPK